MKVNLLINSNAIRNGFLNIDPFAHGAEGKTAGDLSNLDSLVDDAECDQLVADDILDYLPMDVRDAALDNWIKKIRHGGTLSIGGVDIREAASAYLLHYIDLKQVTGLIYGQQRLPCEYRKSTMTLQHVIKALNDRGMDIITKKKYNVCYYTVTARRP